LRSYRRRAVKYDQFIRYDTGAIYDQGCEYCSYYSIIYSSINDTTTPVVINNISPDLVAKFDNIICFIQPINAKLRGYIRKITFSETLTVNIQEEISGFNREPNSGFSSGFDIDNHLVKN
jgi:hypothetical protein